MAIQDPFLVEDSPAAIQALEKILVDTWNAMQMREELTEEADRALAYSAWWLRYAYLAERDAEQPGSKWAGLLAACRENMPPWEA